MEGSHDPVYVGSSQRRRRNGEECSHTTIQYLLYILRTGHAPLQDLHHIHSTEKTELMCRHHGQLGDITQSEDRHLYSLK